MVKTTLVLFALLGILFGSNVLAQTNGYRLTVQMQPVRNDKGVLYVLLENDQAEKVAAQSIKAAKGMIALSFDGIAAGRYAVTILHDENGNQKMDTGIFGIPKEGWACSNDARGIMSAPKFKDKLLQLQGDKTIMVKMTYY